MKMSSMKSFRTYTNLLTNAKLKFSTSSISWKSYYDALGITPKATQNDIKSAYYKLTMIYHPDKNKTEEAKKKFRSITDAYEILGNYKSRKMYDRGMRPGPKRMDNRTPEEIQRDDAQTRFYRARMNRSKVPTTDGRNPIYNFDEWARAHYGDLLERKMTAKYNREKTHKEYKAARLREYNSQIIAFFTILTVVSLTMVFSFNEGYHDMNRINTDKSKSKPP